MGQALQKPIPKNAKKDEPLLTIENRATKELVISLCGAIGSGVSSVAGSVENIFKTYGYTTSIKKITDCIKSKKPLTKNLSDYERIKTLQDSGNDLRKDFGHDYLCQLVVEDILDDRYNRASKKFEKPIKDLDYANEVRSSWKHVTIIECLKNPKEVELLKKVYGNMFFLFGVLCHDDNRRGRLEVKGRGMQPEEALTLMGRDKKEKDTHGQQVLKTLQHADFFIRNNSEYFAIIEKPLNRFVQLILGQNNITPTNAEFGMYIAEASARMSGCMSKQVGAAILSVRGDLISTGRNDVPRPEGGLYIEEDLNNDKRCFKLHGKECENDKGKKKIYGMIADLIRDKFRNVSNRKNATIIDENIISIIEELEDGSEIKDLLEYSRAVHAEMDAITTAARNGNHSLMDATLYSTTFPCHHCARHIVASGIKTVYFIEPYEKSLAKQLHKDAICFDSQAGVGNNGNGALVNPVGGEQKPLKKVTFLHFEGVAPKQYLDLFSCNNRKENGKLKEIDLITQKPAIPSFLDSFIDYETKVVDYLQDNSAQSEEEQDEQR